MRCEFFRQNCVLGTEPAPEMLEHLRECGDCLNHAVSVDPDYLFRSLGGEMTPPGGVDAFVDGVMEQVHLRETEKKLSRRGMPAVYRWAVAATLTIATIGGLQYQSGQSVAPVTLTAEASHGSAIVPVKNQLEPRPVVENYESSSATIVEVPNQTSDLKVVMIFDETLPADL